MTYPFPRRGGIGLGYGIGVTSPGTPLTGGSGFGLLPGDYAADVLNVAVSFGLVVSNYTGPIIRVRRVSDNAEQDFYATKRIDTYLFVDAEEIAAWAGGEARCVTQYNQYSGAVSDMAQPSAARQPRVVRTDGSPVLTASGRPCMSNANGGSAIGWMEMLPDVDHVPNGGAKSVVSIFSGDEVDGQWPPANGQAYGQGCREALQAYACGYRNVSGNWRIEVAGSGATITELSNAQLAATFFDTNQFVWSGDNGADVSWIRATLGGTDYYDSWDTFGWVNTGKRLAWGALESANASRGLDGLWGEIIFHGTPASDEDLATIAEVQRRMWGVG